MKYCLPLICMSLLGLNVYLASRFSLVAQNITQAESRIRQLNQEIETLNLKLAQTRSIQDLSQAAQTLGFTTPDKLVILPKPLAYYAP